MGSVLLMEQSKRIFADKCKQKVTGKWGVFYWWSRVRESLRINVNRRWLVETMQAIDQPAMLINQPVHCFGQFALQMSIYIAEKWKTYKVNNATSHILLYSRRQECKIHFALMPPFWHERISLLELSVRQENYSKFHFKGDPHSSSN